MSYIHDKILEEIENLKKGGHYEEALQMVNNILVRDPSNEDALLQIADIQFLKWEIGKAEKPIDFILSKWKNDPIWFYVKWVLEMEKTNWTEAKKNLRKALELSDFNNPEITRCYWLSEYWSGNREKWIEFIKKAFEQNKFDAEVIYNMIEIHLLEHKYNTARKMIEYFNKNKDKIETFWRDTEFYNEKIELFQEYLNNIIEIK